MKKYHVFIPEYVPLSNKGEEAIVRGIGDSLFPNGQCEIHLFDMEAMEYRFQDGIHVYPGSWFIPVWVTREFGLGTSYEKIRDSFCSLVRHGLNSVCPQWVKITPNPLRCSVSIMSRLTAGHPPRNEKEIRLQQLLGCDFIIAGHDGGLDEWVCHVIRMMRKNFKMEFGVYGVQLRRRFMSNAIMELHAAEFRHGHFFYCRDSVTAEGVKHNFPSVSPEVAPDPAFAMKPATNDIVEGLIRRECLLEFFQKPIVMCTCCEPAPIARYSFDQILNPEGKLRAHRELFASLMRHIAENYDVNILFLPHALGPGRALDDREVARDILRRSCLPLNRARLLETDYGARELKGLIGKGEFLIAERIHSIIGATGVATPFCILGSRKDVRVTGIVEEMLGLPEAIYYLHTPVAKELFDKFDFLWAHRVELKSKLTKKHAEFLSKLTDASKVIKSSFLNET